MSEHWSTKQYLLAWVFDVGRGNCAFVRTPSKDAIIIDCGGDAEPLKAVKKHLLPLCRQHTGSTSTTHVGQIVISHPHVDHFRQILQAEGLSPRLWTCPHDKEPKLGYPDERLNWDLVSNPEGTEELVERYRNAYVAPKRRLPLQTFVPPSEIPHFAYGLFYIPPPQCEPLDATLGTSTSGLPKPDYANNTSIMVYFRFNKTSLLFPGDMMASGMKRALESGCENRLVGEGIPRAFAERSAEPETLRKWVNQGCSVLVAPHHGLQSAYSPEFFLSLPSSDPRVDLVVVSERAYSAEGTGQIHQNYQNRAANKVKGVLLKKHCGTPEHRLCVTTRRDGHCLIGLRGSDDIGVLVANDLEWILKDGPEYVFD